MPNFTILKAPTSGSPITRQTDAWSYRTTRSFPSSKAMAPAPTSGARASACSTPPSRKRLPARKRIAWFEVPAGEKAKNQYGEWLPNDTLEAVRAYKVAIKGPLTTPVGGGIRSLNVTLRQVLDLLCLRQTGPLLHRHAGTGDAPRADGRRDLP